MTLFDYCLNIYINLNYSLISIRIFYSDLKHNIISKNQKINGFFTHNVTECLIAVVFITLSYVFLFFVLNLF